MAITPSISVEYSVTKKPLEAVKGDQAFLHQHDGAIFFGIVDGAGHGPDAHEIANIMCEFLSNHTHLELTELMQALHTHLKGTRGGVAVFGWIDLVAAKASLVGVGNIEMRLFGSQTKRCVLTPGVLGYDIRTPKQQDTDLNTGDVLVLYSDGISSAFDLYDYPNLPWDNAETVATTIVDRFGKNNDDATALVIRIAQA